MTQIVIAVKGWEVSDWWHFGIWQCIIKCQCHQSLHWHKLMKLDRPQWKWQMGESNNSRCLLTAAGRFRKIVDSPVFIFSTQAPARLQRGLWFTDVSSCFRLSLSAPSPRRSFFWDYENTMGGNASAIYQPVLPLHINPVGLSSCAGGGGGCRIKRSSY